MPVKDLADGRIYIPETDQERKALEGLVEKKLVEYHDGGYWLTELGIKVCKKKWGKNGKI